MAEIMLYGPIGDGECSARMVVQKIQGMKAGEPLVVAINSGGGNFFDGEAIYNAIRRYKGRKTIRIDALAASAASYIAMAGDEVVMAPGAQIMIHRPSVEGYLVANEDDLRDILARFDVMTKQMIRVYAQRSGQDEARVREMVQAETWLTAEQALQLGFCDRVDDDLELAALYDSLDRYRYRHVPVAVQAMIRAKPAPKESDAGKEPAAPAKPAPTAKATGQPSDAALRRKRLDKRIKRLAMAGRLHAAL